MIDKKSKIAEIWKRDWEIILVWFLRLTMENKRPLPLIVVVALLLIAGAVFLYRSKTKVEVAPPASPTSETLGEKIYEKAQNPIKDELPQTNPFETKVNPFETETNPFQGVYKNPFGQ